MKTGDTKKDGVLEGATREEIFRAHNNLDAKGKPLNGIVHQGEGCQCDDCKAHGQAKPVAAAAAPAAAGNFVPVPMPKRA